MALYETGGATPATVVTGGTGIGDGLGGGGGIFAILLLFVILGLGGRGFGGHDGCGHGCEVMDIVNDNINSKFAAADRDREYGFNQVDRSFDTQNLLRQMEREFDKTCMIELGQKDIEIQGLKNTESINKNIDNLRFEMVKMNLENQNACLKEQLFAKSLEASQCAQTAAIVNTLSPRSTPSYITNAPCQPVFPPQSSIPFSSYLGLNNGCGGCC